MLNRLREVVREPQGRPVVRRRRTDALRMAGAVALLVPITLHANHPTRTEAAVTRLFASFPRGASSLFLLLYGVASLWVVGVVAVVLLVLRRRALARDVVIAAGLAWVVGRLIAFVVSDTDLASAFRVTFELRDAPRYPMVRVAVAVAATAVVGPWVTRATRYTTRALVVALAIAALYLGKGSLTDLAGALVLGWGIAAAVRLTLGTSSGAPTVEQVGDALAQLGVVASDVRAIEGAENDRRPTFVAMGAAGPLRIVALGREAGDEQLVSRLWRFAAYRDAPPTFLPTRREQIEYEAYVLLLAQRAGAPVPGLVAAGSAGPVALLVESTPAGLDLFDVDPAVVTDDVLGAPWEALRRLRAARIAHGSLDGRHLLLHDGRALVVDFRLATASASEDQLAHDAAQLLAASSAVVGAPRAAAAAVAALGGSAVAASLPFLQPAALSGWTHDRFGGRRALDSRLEEVRTAAAAAAETRVPALRSVYRVEPRTALMAIGAFVAVATLLSRVGDPGHFWHSIQGASWPLVALAVLLGLCADVVFGITFLATVPERVPIWPSVELQVSMAFSNLAVPVAADAAMQVRFLQRQGLDLASAVAAGGVLSSASEIAVQVALFFVAVWLAPNSIHLGHIDTSKLEWVALGLILTLLVATAVVLPIRRVRVAVLDPLRRGARTLWAATKSPGRLAVLVVGNTVTQCLYAGSLLACLAAFGHVLNFWTVLALNIGVSTLASIVPIPGGGTAVRSIGLAGLLTGYGVPVAPAAAAVLTNQVATTYVPAIPGWFAARDLVRRGLL